MKHLRLTLHSLEETEKFAVDLAEFLDQEDIILLAGPLGAGKTTLTQFIAKGLRVPGNYYVTSPSYNLLNIYRGRVPIHHIDCYRLSSEDEIEDAGLLDYIGIKGVTIIEWPDRLGGLMPEEYMGITIVPGEKSIRTLSIVFCGKSWDKRCLQIISYYQ